MRIVGVCNHCGVCCTREGGLVTQNPCLPLAEDICLFYQGSPDGHCMIMMYHSRGVPISQVLDRYGRLITPRQIEWFLANCPDYPNNCIDEPGFTIPDYCSFKVEEDG